MKHSLLVLLLCSIITLISCGGRDKAEYVSMLEDFYKEYLATLDTEQQQDFLRKEMQADRYFIQYRQKINGYTVKQTLTTKDEFEATLCFYFIDDEGAVCRKEHWIEEGYQFLTSCDTTQLQKQQVNEIDYISPDLDFFGTLYKYHNLPFFFLDADFDGEDEMFLTSPCSGRRGGSVYEVYKKDVSDGQWVKFDPFSAFEDWDGYNADTQLDYVNKLIILDYWSSMTHRLIHIYTIKDGKAVPYESPTIDTSKIVCLGDYHDFPYVPLDIDFDGVDEWLVPHPTVGQRTSCGFRVYRVNENGVLEEDDMFLNLISKDFPYTLDDLTDVDFANKEIRFLLFDGWESSAWYYAVKDRKPILLRKEHYEGDKLVSTEQF